MKSVFRLENWQFLMGQLHGNVYGNPAFEDGQYIHTSRVMSGVFPLRQGDAVQTLNSVYQLGVPSDS